MARRGSGRQRIVMEKMQKESARQVTFSKRRVGLMKKGSELCTLCGAEVLIVVFSPGGKVFTFGHPSADAIIHRFLDEEPETTQGIVQAHRCSRQSHLNFHLTQLGSLIDAEKRKGKEIDQERHETEGKVWWEKPIEELSVEQLESLMLKLKECKHNVDEEVRNLLQQGFNGHGLSNVMGTSPYAGLVFDSKGQGSASRLPSGGAFVPEFHGLVPYNPMIARSSGQAPVDPRMPGGWVPFDPTVIGSSSQAPLDPRTLGFYGRLPYNPTSGESGGAVPFDQMAMGSTSASGRSFNPNSSGFQGGDQVDSNALAANNGREWSFL